MVCVTLLKDFGKRWLDRNEIDAEKSPVAKLFDRRETVLEGSDLGIDLEVRPVADPPEIGAFAHRLILTRLAQHALPKQIATQIAGRRTLCRVVDQRADAARPCGATTT